MRGSAHERSELADFTTKVGVIIGAANTVRKLCADAVLTKATLQTDIQNLKDKPAKTTADCEKIIELLERLITVNDSIWRLNKSLNNY